MTEARFQQLETQAEEHDRQICGIYAVLNEVSTTMRAFAQGITELREQHAQFTIGLSDLKAQVAELRQSQQSLIESQRSVIETQRSIMGSVEQLSQTVEQLSQTVAVLSTEAAEDRAVIREMQAEIQQIWEYLLTQRGNGRSE